MSLLFLLQIKYALRRSLGERLTKLSGLGHHGGWPRRWAESGFYKYTEALVLLWVSTHYQCNSFSSSTGFTVQPGKDWVRGTKAAGHIVVWNLGEQYKYLVLA